MQAIKFKKPNKRFHAYIKIYTAFVFRLTLTKACALVSRALGGLEYIYKSDSYFGFIVVACDWAVLKVTTKCSLKLIINFLFVYAAVQNIMPKVDFK